MSRYQILDDAPAAAPTARAGRYEILDGAPDAAAQPSQSWGGWLKSVVTGEGRTEFPDAQEVNVLDFMAMPDNADGAGPAFNRSAITSDPKAQLDILKKAVPNIVSKQDKFGNIMVQAPGMPGFAYLNKPGASWRDLDEVGTQTLATLPLLAVGAGSTLMRTVARGAAANAGASVTNDALAVAAGSEQGINPVNAALAGGIGGALAPGVPTAIATGVRNLASNTAAPVTSLVRAVTNPEAEAARRVAMARGADDEVTAAASRGALTPDAIEAERARQRIQREMLDGGPLNNLEAGGENTRALARSAANQSPSARDELQTVVDATRANQGQRIGRVLDDSRPGYLPDSDVAASTVQRLEATGLPPVTAETRPAMTKAAQEANGPAWNRAYTDGENGLFNEPLAKLTQAPAIQDAMRVANEAVANRQATGIARPTTRAYSKAEIDDLRAGTGVERLDPSDKSIRARMGDQAALPDPPALEYWQQVSVALGDQIERHVTRKERVPIELMEARKQLLATLDDAFPSYKEARGVAHTFFKADDALSAGEKFPASHHRNADAAKALEAMSDAERTLFGAGAVARTIQTIREHNSINGVLRTPAQRERLQIAIGSERANGVLEPIAQREAYDMGQKLASGDLSLDAVRASHSTMNAAQRDAFAEGHLAAMSQVARTTRDSANLLLRLGQSTEAREALALAIGPNKAREFEAFLRIERLRDLPHAAVRGNSTTARQLMEMGLGGAAGASLAGFNPSDPTAWMAALIVGAGTRRAGRAIDQRVATHIAKMLTSTDPNAFAGGVRQVAHSPVIDAIRAVDEAINASGVYRTLKNVAVQKSTEQEQRR